MTEVPLALLVAFPLSIEDGPPFLLILGSSRVEAPRPRLCSGSLVASVGTVLASLPVPSGPARPGGLSAPRPGSPAAAGSAIRLLRGGSCRGRFLHTDSQIKATVFSIHSCSQALFLVMCKLVFSPLTYILNSSSNFRVQNRIF